MRVHSGAAGADRMVILNSRPELTPDVFENPSHKARLKAPRWCPACDAGCSFFNCWLCGLPTVQIDLEQRRIPSGEMRWSPDQ